MAQENGSRDKLVKIKIITGAEFGDPDHRKDSEEEYSLFLPEFPDFKNLKQYIIGKEAVQKNSLIWRFHAYQQLS